MDENTSDFPPGREREVLYRYLLFITRYRESTEVREEVGVNPHCETPLLLAWTQHGWEGSMGLRPA